MPKRHSFVLFFLRLAPGTITRIFWPLTLSWTQHKARFHQAVTLPLTYLASWSVSALDCRNTAVQRLVDRTVTPAWQEEWSYTGANPPVLNSTAFVSVPFHGKVGTRLFLACCVGMTHMGINMQKGESNYTKNDLAFPDCFIWPSIFFTPYVKNLQNHIQTVRTTETVHTFNA